jgi:hypothetical protein
MCQAQDIFLIDDTDTCIFWMFSNRIVSNYENIFKTIFLNIHPLSLFSDIISSDFIFSISSTSRISMLVHLYFLTAFPLYKT